MRFGLCGSARARRPFDPATVAVTRSVHVVTTPADKARAVDARVAARRRVARLPQTPQDDNRATILSYADTAEAAEAGAPCGTPDEIARKLEALRAAGATYGLLNTAGGIDTLRRFARELMPAFAS